MAFLDHSESEEEFDPSSLPDPDKCRDSDQEEDCDIKDSSGYVFGLENVVLWYFPYFLLFLERKKTIFLRLLAQFSYF